MTTIAINEIFRSIQGEGINAGRPCIFIRMQGCNLRCSFCDSSKTHEKTKESHRTLDDIINEVNDLAGETVTHIVITGGEPSIQPLGLDLLTTALKYYGYSLELESNGLKRISVNIAYRFETINISPKENISQTVNGYLVYPGVRFKFVIGSQKDINKVRATEEITHVSKERIILMPMTGTDNDSEIAQMTAKAATDLGYRFSGRMQVEYKFR